MKSLLEKVYPKTIAGRVCTCCKATIPKSTECLNLHIANLNYALCFNCFKSHVVKLLDKKYYTDELLNEVIANKI